MAVLPRRKELKQTRERLETVIMALPRNRREEFLREQEHQLKDPGMYALLIWLFGAGIHHLYLRQYILAAFDIGITVSALALIFLSPLHSIVAMTGGAMLLSIVMINIPSFLFASRQVLHYNNQLTARMLLRYTTANESWPELQDSAWIR